MNLSIEEILDSLNDQLLTKMKPISVKEECEEEWESEKKMKYSVHHSLPTNKTKSEIILGRDTKEFIEEKKQKVDLTIYNSFDLKDEM